MDLGAMKSPQTINLELVQKGRIRCDSLARITRDHCIHKVRTNARAFGEEFSTKHGVDMCTRSRVRASTGRNKASLVSRLARNTRE
ncbi:unnamed protein product [Chrysodeixis includens]|uniref:Uncharacterized protein n=1 Tax=Chrysodeixis includens TaxID=689277 RepID=A0A9N8L4A6_CHRIL|nr:unnamed protein product [Chrysodeixis includens]